MKTLITIAGTLLAGATPFAASAALGNEAATNPAVQEAVVLRRAAQAPPKQAEELELDELRRAIAELRAEKERLRTELSTTQVQGIPLLDRLYGTAVEPRALGEAERLYAVERKLALEQEAAAEEYDRALADLENAEHGLYLDLQAVPSEDGKRIEVRPRLSEAQQKRARAELERKAQRERAAWALAAPG
ncbi:MAG: hypothetical protein KDC14_15355, partial [Planctomycetes bacterium]|nr:hypothetical protein [Planctomycetota bacterium]